MIQKVERTTHLSTGVTRMNEHHHAAGRVAIDIFLFRPESSNMSVDESNAPRVSSLCLTAQELETRGFESASKGEIEKALEDLSAAEEICRPCLQRNGFCLAREDTE